MSDVRDFVTVREAAEILGISPRAVVHRIHAGTLKALKLGPRTAPFVIERSELDATTEPAVASFGHAES